MKIIRNIFKKKPQPNTDKKTVIRCGRCNGKKVSTTGSYTRGWNELCNQAAGDRGAYCYSCGYVTFIRSLEDYKASLPPWVRAFEPNINKNQAQHN